MKPIEQAFQVLTQLNQELMQKRQAGEKLTKEDNAALKEKMRDIHLASSDVEIEELASYLDRYDIGMGMAHIEPSYERVNQAFAFIEARDGGDLEGEDD